MADQASPSGFNQEDESPSDVCLAKNNSSSAFEESKSINLDNNSQEMTTITKKNDYPEEEPEQDTDLDFKNLEVMKEYITKYDDLQKELEEDFSDPEKFDFYLISTKFVSEWKNYVGYEEIKKNTILPKSYGKLQPEKFNYDLIEEKDSNKTYKFNQLESVSLKPELKENVDYYIVNENLMRYFARNFKGKVIQRKAYLLPDGRKRVDIHYSKLNVVVITNSILKDSESHYNQKTEFDHHKIQCFSQLTLASLKKDLLSLINENYSRQEYTYKYYNTSYKIEQVRFWKLDSDITLAQAYEYVRQSCKKQNTYDYRIEMKGKFLDNSLELTIENLNLSPTEYLIAEVREESKGWNFVQDGVPNIEKCEYCSRYEKLNIFCACKKVGYCNEDCRLKDKRFHSMKCDRADEEEEEKDLNITAESRLGLTGLSNLGNTCFMNSALQCISNTYGLTKYFLEKRFLKEINKVNPLGSKGKLAEKYASLLKNLWINKSSVYSPYGIKSAVAQINSIFSGYNQHDSQEFLSFLLDGLHEDLNRIQQKPYTETIESDGRPDSVVAKESWINHLKRNNSIITDYLHGQYRSEITCPECSHISITFDPFLTCTLPIPTKKEKKIEFYYLFFDNTKIPIKMEFTYIKETELMIDLKKKVCQKLAEVRKIEINIKEFTFYFLGNSTCNIVEDKVLVNEVKKKNKMYNLFAVEKNPEFISVPEDEIINVPCTFDRKESYYSSYYSKKQFTFVRPISFLRSDSTMKMNLRIFQYFKPILEEYASEDDKKEFADLNDTELYARIFGNPTQRLYDVLICTNSRGYWLCYFCQDSKCDNCKLSEKDDESLSDLLAKIKNSDFTFELEVYWPKNSEGMDLNKRLNRYETLEKKEESEDSKEEKLITRNYTSSYYGKGYDNKSTEERSIYDCFDQFEAPELLTADNMWYCSKCKKHQPAKKEMKIYKAPQYLIIHLKRFRTPSGAMGYFSSSIISTKVDFPLELDLSDYVMSPDLPGQETNQKDKSSLMYNLYAVSNHFGSVNCGHYTAFAKNARMNSWYNFDDSSVSPVSAESVVSGAAYILFYEKKGINKNCVFEIEKEEEKMEEIVVINGNNISDANKMEEIQPEQSSSPVVIDGMNGQDGEMEIEEKSDNEIEIPVERNGED